MSTRTITGGAGRLTGERTKMVALDAHTPNPGSLSKFRILKGNGDDVEQCVVVRWPDARTGPTARSRAKASVNPGFSLANVLQVVLVIALVGAAYVPLGDYMARVCTPGQVISASRR
jgi:hypothetical protein